MTITIHRGINQIGGCFTEIATASTKIFLAQVCQAVNPTTAIIPIHSQHSDDFKKLPINEELKEKIVTTSDIKQNIKIVIKKIV